MRRRTFLLGALGATAACADTTSPPAPTSTSTPLSLTTEVVRSAARGTDVTMVVLRPRQALDRKLPVCVALHGRGDDAGMIVDLGVQSLLNDAATPFAMVGLDGGDSYWVARDPADDPQRMLAEELPGWLDERNLETTPFAAFGLSMGAYGALNYARRTPHPAVAILSPALFLNWPDARTRDAFAGEEQWAATDPFQHLDALGDTPLGIWCGTDDPFFPAVERFAGLAKPQVTRFTPGGHDPEYFVPAMREVVDFVAAQVP